MQSKQATKIVRPRLAEHRPTEQWLAMQYVVSCILVEVTTLEEAFRRTLQAIGEVLGWEAGAFWTIDQTANALRCNTTWHTPAISATVFEAVSMQTTFPPGIGLPGRVWATGQPVWIPDVLKDTNFPRYKMAISENLHGAFAFPVSSASGFLGVIEFFSRKIQQADDELIRAVITIGNQLGQFIEKKRLEEEARENEWRYRALFEQAAIGIIHMGLDGRLLLVNQSFCDIIGYSREELLHMRFQDFIHPDYLETSLALGHLILVGDAHPYSMEKRYIRKDGSVIWVRVTMSLIRMPSNEPKHFVAIVEDIHERKQHELALREAKRRMDEFLGIASHELKTPLTAIKTSIQLAERYLKRITPSNVEDVVISRLGETQELLRRTGRQIDVINRLVSDLIDISRVDADKLVLRLHPEPCDVATIVREVVEVQRRVISSRAIHLKISTRKALPVIADVDRVAQVLANYLSNAQKYSSPERPIEVSLHVREGVVRVAVRDEGPGLPPNEQKRVWERFYRAEGIENQGSSGIGLGLGLYISRMIIEQHHGQVGVESAPGKGSTFWFTLPLAPVI
jgi:PAS domain S-box-containing protein